ncbi:cytosine/adenosine deaminase-related metal-dependent hydrolase [Allocatelliglobosispora scoriae]|uniref:Cytosine/adenosine deaminase-related metal-dependent hydrolase n=1 Tax=Allocatelliglobosispora scoriae TaxID=643052 RepID=A0A841BR15_9ACTN|nr:formimidoylglutamate deiminase [Allocatelliglobosispora scoriae]MBB5870145.1 cytosine/adenosine deaminase-related metal-dependent hydrolase [Allocatelliglobosispora scoriae]
MLIWCEAAWLPDGIAREVLIEFDSTITRIAVDVVAPPGVPRRAGLTIPGLANVHSHAFHRALRGRTHAERGSFWTWRELMYKVAARLDPDSYFQLARATYAEMALAGITSVGEFHYLHRAPGGVAYRDPNAMAEALIAAAAEAGIRITLLDTLYLTASVDGEPLAGPQLRFSDGSLDAWSARHDLLPRFAANGGLGARNDHALLQNVAGDVGGDQDRRNSSRGGPQHLRVGAALHSVRAVPAELMRPFAERTAGQPVHVHLSEQRAENEACLVVHGCTPTELLDRHGVLSPQLTAVHATHLTPADIKLLSSGYACFCPTTERDLGDGIGPAGALAEAGVRLNLGSDSHAVIDLLEEARALELHERLATERRGHFAAADLLAAATVTGHAALGWDDAGHLAVGQRADLVTLSLESPRTAGIDPEGVLFAASAADITHVVADGREIVADGRHATVDVPRELREAITCLF